MGDMRVITDRTPREIDAVVRRPTTLTGSRVQSERAAEDLTAVDRSVAETLVDPAGLGRRRSAASEFGTWVPVGGHRGQGPGEQRRRDALAAGAAHRPDQVDVPGPEPERLGLGDE